MSDGIRANPLLIYLIMFVPTGFSAAANRLSKNLSKGFSDIGSGRSAKTGMPYLSAADVKVLA